MRGKKWSKKVLSEKGQDPARSLVNKVKILVAQSCLTLYNPVIVQARILEWVAIPFSKISLIRALKFFERSYAGDV